MFMIRTAIIALASSFSTCATATVHDFDWSVNGAATGQATSPYCTTPSCTADPRYDAPLTVNVGDSVTFKCVRRIRARTHTHAHTRTHTQVNRSTSLTPDGCDCRWIDFATYPAADGMLHDIFRLDDASTCDFAGKTGEPIVTVQGMETCGFTAGDENSCTAAGKCTYDAATDMCTSKPRWRTATVGPFDAVGTHVISCSVGSADWCTAMGGSMCPVGELQAWAHCEVFGQKLVINVASPDPAKASGATLAASASFVSAIVIATAV